MTIKKSYTPERIPVRVKGGQQYERNRLSKEIYRRQTTHNSENSRKKKERKKESQHKIHKLSVRERDREVAWESGRENKH